MNAKGIKILSIGRFCKAKNFDNVPEICQRIRERGMDITWYLIGFGRDEELIKRKIAEANMQEYVKILGKKRIHIHIFRHVMFIYSLVDMKVNVLRFVRLRC